MRELEGVEEQRRYFPMRKAAVAQKNARADQAAMLEDRIWLREGKTAGVRHSGSVRS